MRRFGSGAGLTAWMAALSVSACGGPGAPPILATSDGSGASRDAGSGGTSGGSGSTSPGSSGASGAGASPDGGSGSSVVDDPAPVASTIYENAAHTGSVTDAALVGPLVRAWDVDLGGPSPDSPPPSYPLIARGLVYVMTYSGLLAVDARTGGTVWGPIDVGSGFAAHAYEAGRVFVTRAGAIPYTGIVESFDSATGSSLWSVDLQTGFASAPTTYEGVLYSFGSEGVVDARSETSGAPIWSAPLYVNSGGDSPSVTDDGVFVASGCATALDRRSGKQLWSAREACGGGGGASVLFGDRYYASTPLRGSLVLDAKSGALEGAYSGDPPVAQPPAFDGSLGFFVSGGSIHASDTSSFQTIWSFENAASMVVTPPLVVGGRVYVGSYDGRLHGLEETSGIEQWSDDLSADELVVCQPGAGDLRLFGAPPGTSLCPTWGGTPFAAAEGVLVVIAGNHMVGYRAAAADAGAANGMPSDGGDDASP